MTDENTPPAAETDIAPEPAAAESHAAHPPAETAPHADRVAESHPLVAEPEPADETPAAETPADVAAETVTEPVVEAAETPVAEAEVARPKRARKPKAAAVADATEAEPAAGAEGEAGADAVTPAEPAESAADSRKKWYVVKIQSGREDSIKAAIERKVKIEGLEDLFGQIAIPVEETILKKSVKVKDKKTGDKVTQEKKVVKHTKKYPGYLFAEVEFNDRMLYLFRETSGVGDFVGAGLHREPTALTDLEVTQMLTGVVDKDARRKGTSKQVVKLDFEKGDKVKIRDGAFANMEGEVKLITESKDVGETPKVKVEVTIFGRPVEVDLDYWHVDKV